MDSIYVALVLVTTESTLQHEPGFSHSHSFTGGRGWHTRCHRWNCHREQLGFSILPKDTSTCRPQGSWIKLPTFLFGTRSVEVWACLLVLENITSMKQTMKQNDVYVCGALLCCWNAAPSLPSLSSSLNHHCSLSISGPLRRGGALVRLKTAIGKSYKSSVLFRSPIKP